MNQLYCDGIEEVTVTGGIVRIDFYAYVRGAAQADGRPPRETLSRLLLSPDGFVQSLNALERVVGVLEQRGLVQRRSKSGAQAALAAVPASAGTPAGGAEAPKEEKSGKRRASPNF